MDDVLTKRRALEICILMWDWLADHPEQQDKREAIFALALPDDMECDCAACEYDSQQGGDNCVNCPIWTREEDCLSQHSPFVAWSYATELRSDTSAHARAIADLAREKLADLDEEGA